MSTGLPPRLGQLDQRIRQLEEQVSAWQQIMEQHRVEDQTPSTDPRLNHRLSIVVIGASRVEGQVLIGIAKRLGLEPEQLDLRLDYAAIDKSLIDHLRWNPSVAGVLCGPVPHSASGATTDPIALLDRDEFPPLVRLEPRAGGLKISKDSFRRGLGELLNLLGEEASSPRASGTRHFDKQGRNTPMNTNAVRDEFSPATAVRAIEYLLSVQECDGDLAQVFVHIHHQRNEPVERHLAYLRGIKRYAGQRNVDVLQRLLVMKRGAQELFEKSNVDSVDRAELFRLAQVAVALFPVDDLPRRGE